jgi:hypothetical protein
MHNTSHVNLWVGCVQLVDRRWFVGAQNRELSHYPQRALEIVGISGWFIPTFSQVVHTLCAQQRAISTSVAAELSTLSTGLTTRTTKYKERN